MPEGAPIPKVAGHPGVRRGGALPRAVGRRGARRPRSAFAEETGAVLVHPFDHPDDRGRAGHRRPGDPRAGARRTHRGGLHRRRRAARRHRGRGEGDSGRTSASSACRPRARRRTRRRWPPASRSRWTAMATMADGIAVGCPGTVPFALVHELVDEIVTVSEESLSRALLLCLERAKLVVEPAGAAGVAALLDDPSAFEPPVVVVLSGGNIDPLLLMRVLRHGLAVAGPLPVAAGCGSPTGRARWCSCSPRWPRPTRSVLEVEHVRTDAAAAGGRGRGPPAARDPRRGALRPRCWPGCARPATRWCSADLTPATRDVSCSERDTSR